MPDSPSNRGQIRHELPPRYMLLEQIGAGGMGVVYRAIDTQLNRAVAIKAIHEDHLRDPRAASRLRAEALAAASLDHPYICKIYELLEQGDDTLIVMEFVEGETLSTILRRGVPPLADTIRYAAEIAEGLANAHGRGLVHRDVKPSNVLITPSGHVKLLDFGLARVDVSSAPGAETRTSPTAVDLHAGTPHYMAPEQATDAPVTARADLFSLGVVLFECLTGKLPFAGTTSYDYVRHLLSDDPRALDRLAPFAPADLVRLVERCLEKNPGRRAASAAEIVDELHRLSSQMSSGTVQIELAGAVRARRRWRRIGAAAIVPLAAVALWRWWPQSDERQLFRQSRPFVTSPNQESDSQVSPDGRWVSFLSEQGGTMQLFVQPIDGSDARAVTLPSGELESQAWSPDGRELACVIAQNEQMVLVVVPAFFGGAPRLTVPVGRVTRARLVRWIGGDVYVVTAYGPQHAVQRIRLSDRSVTDVSQRWKLPGPLRDADVSPDGRRVVLSVADSGIEHLWLGGLDGADIHQLTSGRFFERRPIWSGAGRTIIYQSNRGGQLDLWEIEPASGRSWALTSSATEEEAESTTPDGAIVSFVQTSEDSRVWVWDMADARGRQVTADTLSDFSPTASADGRTIAFQRLQPSPSNGYVILDAKLFVGTFDAAGSLGNAQAVADGFAPRLSPDGTKLAYLSRSAQPARVAVHVKDLQSGETVQVSPTGMLPTLSLLPVDWAEQNLTWSPDSAELFFVDQPDMAQIRRHRIGSTGSDAPVFAAGQGELIRDLRTSPDGQQLAFVTRTRAANTLHVLDLRTGRQTQTSFDRPAYCRGWLADGSAVVIVSPGAIRPDGTVDLTIRTVMPGRRDAVATTVDGVYIATTRFDPGRGALLFTRAETGIDNLFEYVITSRTLRRLTDNALPGVTFSGYVPLGRGRLAGVRDERKQDIWLMEARPANGSHDAGGGR